MPREIERTLQAICLQITLLLRACAGRHRYHATRSIENLPWIGGDTQISKLKGDLHFSLGILIWRLWTEILALSFQSDIHFLYFPILKAGNVRWNRPARFVAGGIRTRRWSCD